MVRAKFKCKSVMKEFAGGNEFTYTTKFEPVVGGSPENESFFKWTPHGDITLSTIQKDHFVPGKEYYLDFTLVE